MSNVIDIRAVRAQRKIPINSYFVRIDQYEDGLCGAVLLDDQSVDDLRGVSEDLFAFARHVRDEVWARTQDPDDRQISVTRIYGSSRVNCWTSNDIQTDEQVAWLATRFRDAAQASGVGEP